MKSLSIIIPTYNESLRIVSTISKTRNILEQSNIDYEIIIVDDGSKDSTADTISNLNIEKTKVYKLDKNHGKGFAVRFGLKKSSKDFALFMDADGSTSFSHIPVFLNVALENNYDIICASRTLEESKILGPTNKFRNILRFFFKKINKILFGFSNIDTQCGFKLFSKRALEKLLPLCKENGFIFDIEILIFAKNQNLKITELPVKWHEKKTSTLNPIIDPIKMLIGMIRLKLKSL